MEDFLGDTFPGGGEFCGETILRGLFSEKDFLGHLIAANNFMENFNLCFT